MTIPTSSIDRLRERIRQQDLLARGAADPLRGAVHASLALALRAELRKLRGAG